MSQDSQPQKTPLYDFHVANAGKIVDFAGYMLPVQYALGVMGEHLQCRQSAALFDVSHMGQALLSADDGYDAAVLMEELVPGGITSLGDHRIRYTLLTDDGGGIRDDLMVTRRGDNLWLVVNAACKDNDFAHIADTLAGRATLEVYDRALLALQGPKAVDVLDSILPGCADLPFMGACAMAWQGHDVFITRCGYTGEDGFEISIDNELATQFAELLISYDAVGLCGLGARDSLRLEAGLCLYGHDIDIETTPFDADLMWTIPQRRREAMDFPGAQNILSENNTVMRKRVGIQPMGRAPAREGVQICDLHGNPIGVVTSGGFAPSLSAPIAMGYVTAPHHELGTEVHLMVRGKALPAKVCDMPFVPHNYVSSKRSS